MEPNSIWIDGVSWVHTDTIKFDTEISTMNPKQNEIEYMATKDSIEKIGQNRPLQINSITKLTEDGRTRLKIARELGREVLVQYVDGNASLEKRIMCANENTMTGREYNNAQKAVWSLRLMNKTGHSAIDTAKTTKVDSRLISYAVSINGLGRIDILDEIMVTGGYVFPGEKRSFTSMRTIAGRLNEESERNNIIKDSSNVPKIDYNELVATETGRNWFWEQVNGEQLSMKTKLLLVELSNFKFKLNEN